MGKQDNYIFRHDARHTKKNMVFYAETMDHPENIIVPWWNGTRLGQFSPCRAEFIRLLDC